MASVAPDEDWQPPPHEPEIGDIESYQAFARALNAPPKKLIPIGERDRRWYNKKSHILLEADPEALVTPEKLAQWRPNIDNVPVGERRCPQCGHAHKNPKLVKTYCLCHHCSFIHEPASTIASMVKKKWLREQGKIRILAASYGHPSDAAQAVDCTAALEALCEKSARESLFLDRTEDLRRTLSNGTDPAPGHRKVVIVRYILNGRRGTVSTWEGNFAGRLKEDFEIKGGAARPLINIVRAQYGQPGGIKNGRGAFDVTDSLQARVHAARGRFCIVKRDEHLPSWFGEPSLGRAKTLTVEYEINGSSCGVLVISGGASRRWRLGQPQWHRLDDHRRDANDASSYRRNAAAREPARRVTRVARAGSAGEMHEYELNGKLMYPMSVAASPSVAPQILIENASYGWTEELLDEWKARYHKDIFDMLISASRTVPSFDATRIMLWVVSFSNLRSAQASDPSQKDCGSSSDARGQQSTAEVASDRRETESVICAEAWFRGRHGTSTKKGRSLWRFPPLLRWRFSRRRTAVLGCCGITKITGRPDGCGRPER